MGLLQFRKFHRKAILSQHNLILSLNTKVNFISILRKNSHLIYYRLFKVIDETNSGEIEPRELENFIENLYNNAGIEFKKSDIEAVYIKLSDFLSENKAETIKFDSFLAVMESWFIQCGAYKFVSDKDLRHISSMTEQMGRGFHKIIKAFFINDFIMTSQLIEEGKDMYQDIENSILDMSVAGKFEQYSMDEKSESLDQSKTLQFSQFKLIIEELRSTDNIENIKNGLDTIIKIFEFVNKIVIDHEQREIVQDISGVYQLIICTDLISKLSNGLDMIDSREVYLIKIAALRILCYLSLGLTFFNPVDEKCSLLPNKNYFDTLSQFLTDPDLIFRLKNCLSSNGVEVVEQAGITIGYFVKNDVEISEKLNEYKILDVIISLVFADQTDEINKMALWGIYNICKKYLPLTEKLPKKKEEDEIYDISLAIGKYMFQTEITPENITCHCYVVLSFSYILEHIIGYADETKWIGDHIVNLVKNSSDSALLKGGFITITRSIQNDSKFATLFTADNDFWNKGHQLMIDASDSSRMLSIIRFISELSACGQLSIDSSRFTTLHYIFNMSERQGKEIMKMFINHIHSAGGKSLFSNIKDFLSFVFSGISNFINRDDKIVNDIYNKNSITIDIVYFIKSGELLENLSKEATFDQFEANLTENIVKKLEDTVLFLYDCYTQWEEENSKISFGAHIIDNVVDTATKLFIEILKHIEDKLIPPSSILGYSRDQGFRNARDKLGEYINALESKTNPNYRPKIIEEHKFVDSDIFCRIYDEYTRDSKEFLMNENTTVYELKDEISKIFRLQDPVIEHIDDQNRKTFIDCDEALIKALQYSFDVSMNKGDDRATLDLMIDKESGYWFICKHCRKDFGSKSKFGHNDYCDNGSNYNARNNRSRTPLVERSRTNIGTTTPSYRSRMGDGYERTQSTRYTTPIRTNRRFY